MPSWRALSRSISTSRSIESMTEFAQLLFDRIVIWADDFGHLEGDPVVIKATVKPLSPRKPSEFADAVAEMVRISAVAARVVGGRIYLQVAKHDQHQPGLHKRTKSRFPDPASCRPFSAEEYLDACRRIADGELLVVAPNEVPQDVPVEVPGNSGLDVDEIRRDLDSPPVVPLPGDAARQGKSAKRAPSRANRGTATEIVEAFQVEEGHRQWAAEKAPHVDIGSQTECWRDYLRANGYRTRAGPVRDAAASWRTWMTKAEQWTLPRGSNGISWKPAIKQQPGADRSNRSDDRGGGLGQFKPRRLSLDDFERPK